MPLKKVAEIEIPDAYGEPRGDEVNLSDFSSSHPYAVDRFRAVLDLLGEAYQALAQARAMRLGGEPGDQP